MNNENTIMQIPIEDLVPNRQQPRLNFDDQGLQDLAKSIKEHGIIQPLVVRKVGEKYEIIAGERRYRASMIAGLLSVPAILSNMSAEESAQVALTENIQRRELTCIEEAKSYQNILDNQKQDIQSLANKIGVSVHTIENKLKLLQLDEAVQEALLKEQISERHARSLLNIEDHAKQKEWLNRIIKERLTVRQLDLAIKKEQNPQKSADEKLLPNIEKIFEETKDVIKGVNIEKNDASLDKQNDIITLGNNSKESEPVEEIESLDFSPTIKDEPEDIETLDFNVELPDFKKQFTEELDNLINKYTANLKIDKTISDNNINIVINN